MPSDTETLYCLAYLVPQDLTELQTREVEEYAVERDCCSWSATV
jgi:hypothetical protein